MTKQVIKQHVQYNPIFIIKLSMFINKGGKGLTTKTLHW